MREFDKLYSLSLRDDDRLAEDLNTMIAEQDNKSKCIRTILLDFVKENGIINNYTDIPKKERLRRFFGYFGETVNRSGNGKRKGRRKCICQFIISPHNDFPSGPECNVLVMLNIQDNASDCIRDLLLDFVQANGVVANYADISEKERLERFFGHVERAVIPAKQPGRTVRMLKDKNIEVRQYYEGTRYVSSEFVIMTPDGKKVCGSI